MKLLHRTEKQANVYKVTSKAPSTGLSNWHFTVVPNLNLSKPKQSYGIPVTTNKENSKLSFLALARVSI